MLPFSVRWEVISVAAQNLHSASSICHEKVDFKFAGSTSSVKAEQSIYSISSTSSTEAPGFKPMHPKSLRWVRNLALQAHVMACIASPARAQYGPVLTGAGPINRSMGGTAVALPIDATGALYWNPATTTALPGSSLDFGLEFLAPHTRLESSLPANLFGPGVPPPGFAGSTQAENGVFPLPSVGLVYRPDDSELTYGLGVFPVAGFGVNYASSTSNPILSPQPPNGFGLGSICSELQVMQIAPTLAFPLGDHLSIGVGPTLSLARLRLDPLLIAGPDDANGNGFGSYPSGGHHTRIHWGGGFQVGIYFDSRDSWSVGASLKSPQWFEPFQFQSVDELGRPRNDSVRADLPLMASIGVGYTGFDRWSIGADVRYIDFANADGFGDQGYAPTGAVRGLGWDSVFTVSLGAEYRLTEWLSLRGGYSYGQNPIPDSESTFNVASPTTIEHTLSVGASWHVSEPLTLSVAYAHGFENAIAGPLVLPTGTVPGTLIRSTTSADMVLLGGTVRFGPSYRPSPD
jgi:long-chain fatty acid transport protein